MARVRSARVGVTANFYVVNIMQGNGEWVLWGKYGDVHLFYRGMCAGLLRIVRSVKGGAGMNGD